MKVAKCSMYESRVENTYTACFGIENADGISSYGLSKVGFRGIDGVHFGGSLDDFFAYVLSSCNFCICEEEVDGSDCQFDIVMVYVHELEIAGYCILSYLLGLGYIQNDEWLADGKYIKFISGDGGEFYMIGVHFEDNKLVVFRNSCAVLPLSVAEIRDSFCNTYLSLDFGISSKEYVCNTACILSEAMYLAIESGLNRLTLGSSAFNLLRRNYGFKYFKEDFPYLEDECDSFIRRSYRGGFGYINKNFVGDVVNDGCVLDCNSLYPHIMMANKYELPYGEPIADLSGDSLSGLSVEDFYEKFSYCSEEYHFLEFSCSFRLKENKIPFLSVEGDRDSLRVGDGVLEDTFVDDELLSVNMVLSQTDFLLMLRQYEIEDFVPIRLVTFRARGGLLRKFLETYAKKKQSESGGKRVVDKLIMNIISGKMGTKRHRHRFQINYSNGEIGFEPVANDTKSLGYVPYASAVTSYGRWITVNACQANYGNVLYSNVDCMALRCSVSEARGVHIHDSKIGYWKVEHKFDRAIFAKSQTYVLQCGDEYVIKASGMTDRCKKILECYFRLCDLLHSEGCNASSVSDLLLQYEVSREEVEWLKGMSYGGIENFHSGLVVPSNYKVMRSKGCLNMVCTDFRIL